MTTPNRTPNRPLFDALIDGVPADAIPVADRGLQYGDGLFETIAVVNGDPCLWGRHLARLRAGCARLAIPPPPDDQLTTEALRLTRGIDRAVLKVIVTRGDGGRGYRPAVTPKPRRILGLGPWPSHPDAWATQGVRVRYCRTRLSHQPLLAGLKHLNRLEQVLARAEWDDPAVPEGLMLDSDGLVVEGTQSNVFAVAGGRLLTPLLDQCGVAGVVRDLVLAQARALGLAVVEAALEPALIEAADALFLTSSLIGIWPVRELAGVSFDPDRVPPTLRAAVLAAAIRP
jgi:4-amino-4-deoxychorismate lyase